MFFAILSRLVHKLSFKMHRMIAWMSNYQSKLTKKKFGDPKLGPKLVFLSLFSQVCIISSDIAQDCILGQ